MVSTLPIPGPEERPKVEERLRRMVRRWPEVSGCLLQPDPDTVEGIVQALVREDGLSQVEAAVLLNKHKSWVCRRLALLERLGAEAQAAGVGFAAAVGVPVSADHDALVRIPPAGDLADHIVAVDASVDEREIRRERRVLQLDRPECLAARALLQRLEVEARAAQHLDRPRPTAQRGRGGGSC